MYLRRNRFLWIKSDLFSKMRRSVVTLACLLQCAISVKVKVVLHSDQEDSRVEDEESHTEAWGTKRKEGTLLPFIKNHRLEEKQEYDDVTTTEKSSKQLHPNEMIFPLIYRQSHINSMFKFGENWYTWSTEKRSDGSKATNYYICYDEPKHCDEVGWERTDGVPKCAFEIDSLLPEDRACINSFGIEPHGNNGICDGGEQMKVSEMVRSCGPRIRSLWRFIRVARRPSNAAKPADVNSLICEDEEECYITIEYRIHHDRITFSLHEPTRGQTFKSALKREISTEEENRVVSMTESHPHTSHRGKKVSKVRDDETGQRVKKFHTRSKSKQPEGKGLVKEHNDSTYTNRMSVKNKIKIREDISEDMSD